MDRKRVHTNCIRIAYHFFDVTLLKHDMAPRLHIANYDTIQ